MVPIQSPLSCRGGTISDAEYKRLFQLGIDQSVALEKKDAQSAPKPPAAPASVPTGQNPTAPSQLARAFSGQVVSISESSITVKTEGKEKTLVIDSKTALRDFKNISEIKVGSEVGVRVDAEDKQALLLRPWPPK